MGANKKLITLLVFLLLAFVGLNLFLISKYKTQLSKQTETKKAEETEKVPFPQINTFELPPAKVGAGYYGEVFATLTGTNEELTINVSGLPDGLTLGKCDQTFDSKFIPTPNTKAKCLIEGIPAKAGIYQVKITGSTAGNYNNVENIVNLSVLESQTSKK